MSYGFEKRGEASQRKIRVWADQSMKNMALSGANRIGETQRVIALLLDLPVRKFRTRLAYRQDPGGSAGRQTVWV